MNKEKLDLRLAQRLDALTPEQRVKAMALKPRDRLRQVGRAIESVEWVVGWLLILILALFLSWLFAGIVGAQETPGEVTYIQTDVFCPPRTLYAVVDANPSVYYSQATTVCAVKAPDFETTLTCTCPRKGECSAHVITGLDGTLSEWCGGGQ